MPVPVPKQHRPPTHQVNKASRKADWEIQSASVNVTLNSAVFQVLVNDLPRHPAGPPAGLGSREEWLKSLPNWRRNKRREVFGSEDGSGLLPRSPSVGRERTDLQAGWIAADYASICKKERAEACHSPAYDLEVSISSIMPGVVALTGVTKSNRSGYDGDDESSLREDNSGYASGFPGCFSDSCSSARVGSRRSFRHVHDDHSDSSKRGYEYIRPVAADKDSVNYSYESTIPGVPACTTPFAEYVDRLVTSDANNAGEHFIHDPHVDTLAALETPRRLQAPAAEPVTDPAFINAYRAMAKPLSEWIADYIWRVCTTGMSLPPRFVGSSVARRYSEEPPSHLARSIRLLLCSTLLQPSGIVLALWYIARLPVCFEWQVTDATAQSREAEFRRELLGPGQQNSPNPNADAVELQVPFRLVLLGCMLANKWLDDHTFSNKTWHTISDIPVQNINRLELLALAILAHDLSVPPRAWDQWLAHLRSYHQSLSSYPAPIRRPSSMDADLVVRKVIDDLIQLQAPPGMTSALSSPSPKTLPQPVFSALVDHFAETQHNRQVEQLDPLEIDLDEDGPLREEYVPKRRSSGAKYGAYMQHSRGSSTEAGEGKQGTSELPPPARWSPKEDPPIERDRDKRDRRELHQPLGRDLVSNGSSRSLPENHPWWFGRQDIDTSRAETSKPFAYAYPFATQTSIGHIRSTSTSASSAGGFTNVVHIRSYSQSLYDQDTITGPAYPRGHSWYHGGYSLTHDNPTHYQPMWLQT